MTAPTPITSTTPLPPPGTVVIAHGLTGTAYQRFYSDGLFHGVHGRNETFDYFLRRAAKNEAAEAPLSADYILLMGEA